MALDRRGRWRWRGSGVVADTFGHRRYQRVAIDRSERLIVIADGSKIGAATNAVVAPVDRISVLVTDQSADPAEVATLKSAGVDVVFASAERASEGRARNDADRSRPAMVAAAPAGGRGGDKMSSLGDLFGVRKPVIAMLHFPALPGRPRHDRSGGEARLLDAVGSDLLVLQDAGVDGVLFCNEADLPYQLRVGPEIPAAMAAIIGELRRDLRVPYGVNVLWDAIASLALARATGARFIREVLTGVYESDLGMIEPRIGEIAGYRTAIGADDVLLFDNVQPEFASAIGSRSVADRARGAAFLGVDAILISGPAAGAALDMRHLAEAREAARDTPVIANTGVRAERIREIFSIADGVIVGTSLKVDGVTWNPVDPERARRLVDAAGQARSALPVG